MLRYNVKIGGLTPMLLDNSRVMQVKEPKNQKDRDMFLLLQTYKYVKDASGNPHPLSGPDDGHMYFPSKGVLLGFYSATKLVPHGRGKLFSVLSGWVDISPENYILMTRDGKPIDSYDQVSDFRTTINRNNKARIAKTNPQVNKPWGLEFTLIVESQYIAKTSEDALSENIKVCLNIAGGKFGIGAWGPRSGGRFGKYEVLSFELVSRE